MNGIESCERNGLVSLLLLLLTVVVVVVDSCYCLSLVGPNFWRWRFFQIPNSSLALVDLKMSLVMVGEHVHLMAAIFESRSLKIPMAVGFSVVKQNTRVFVICVVGKVEATTAVDIIDYHVVVAISASKSHQNGDQEDFLLTHSTTASLETGC